MIARIAFIYHFPIQLGLVLTALVFAYIGAADLGFAIGEGKLRELLVHRHDMLYRGKTLCTCLVHRTGYTVGLGIPDLSDPEIMRHISTSPISKSPHSQNPYI